MGLDIPNLDEKNFDILVEEAINKIPSLAPKWTNYNLSDPGITIIELLAWLSDINYYRLNRVGSKYDNEFLKILNINHGENQGSKVILTFSSWLHTTIYDKNKNIDEMDNSKKILVPKGTEVISNQLRFVTQKDFYVFAVNFDILSLYVKGYGEKEEMRKNDFYPFGKELLSESYFLIELTHKISDDISFYFVTSENLETFEQTNTLEWSCYDEDTQTWVVVHLDDNSSSLTQSGEVVLKLPVMSNKIKCTLKDLSYYETPPFVKDILINSTLVFQEDEHNEFLGESSGYVNQHFSLTSVPSRKSMKVKVGREIWQCVEDLKTCRGSDKVYMTHYNEIIFGDGANGMVPEYSLDIYCEYMSNAGSKGNVPIKTDWKCEKIKTYETQMEVVNKYEGRGGQDRKSNEDLFKQFQSSLKMPQRAVTLKDYEYLSLQTPNTKLVKAKAFSDLDKNKVTVIVIPYSEDNIPKAKLSTKIKVEQYLDTKRLLTTKVQVIDPKYKAIHITATIFSQKHNPNELQINIKKKLAEYLHPLYGGKNNAGWSFGESVYLSALYEVISSIEGVDTIEKLKINSSTVSMMKIEKDTLITSGNHFVEVKGLDPLACRS